MNEHERITRGVIITDVKRRRNSYHGGPAWTIVTEYDEYTTQADAQVGHLITGNERGMYEIVLNANRSVIGLTKHDPDAWRNEVVGKYATKVDGVEYDHADTLIEAKRARDTIIYGRIGTESNTTIEKR